MGSMKDRKFMFKVGDIVEWDNDYPDNKGITMRLGTYTVADTYMKDDDIFVRVDREGDYFFFQERWKLAKSSIINKILSEI